MPYSDYSNLNVSEKIIIAHVHGRKRIYNFSVDDLWYSKVMPNFVVAVNINGVEYTSTPTKGGVDPIFTPGNFCYEIDTGKLYLESYSDNDEIIVTYRYFFSNNPINLSWDLHDYSKQVEYLPRITSSPSLKSQMCQGKNGISLSGSGNLVLQDNDSVVSDLFKGVILDNKNVEVYSYNKDLMPSDARILFRGIILNKNIDVTQTTLSLKDSIYTLDAKIPLVNYGTLTKESDSKRFKRVVYGRVDNLLCQSIDQVGDGYSLQGTLSGTVNDKILYGTNTNFFADVTAKDTLIFSDFNLEVEEVLSPTTLSVSKIPRSFVNLTCHIKPDVHFSNKNRTFQVAGHAIKKQQTQIVSIISRNRLQVSTTIGFSAGDTISINGEDKVLRRISGDVFVLQTNYNIDHSVGDYITKLEIENIRYNKNISILNTDVTINNTTEATFTLSPKAEYNAATTYRLNTLFRFMNNRNKIWLGTPSLLDITCVAQTQTGSTHASFSLFGKYFSVKDQDGNTTAFWFKDDVDESVSQFPKPAAVVEIEAVSGGRSSVISLQSRTYTSTEIAKICADVICDKVNCWQYSLTNNVINLESKDTLSISTGSMGDSGFTQSHTAGAVSTSTISLKDIFKPRYFVKAMDESDSTYNEILAVDDRCITLRTPYLGTSLLKNIEYKAVEYIQDDSKVFCDCWGKTKDGTTTGELIRTTADVTYDILKSIGLESSVDVASFAESSLKAPYLVSIALPLNFSDEQLPVSKEVINLMNQSALGSIHIADELKIGYDILDASVKNGLYIIKDEDILSWYLSEDSYDLASTTIARYHFVDYDPSKDDSSNSQITYNSDFATKYISSINTSENDYYLYSYVNSMEILQRDQFVNSLSSRVIKVKASLTLSHLKISDRVSLDFRRLKTTGIVSSIVNSGKQIEIEILDLGNAFDRSTRITNNSHPEYSLSNDSEKFFGSFMTQDNGITDNDQNTHGYFLVS